LDGRGLAVEYRRHIVNVLDRFAPKLSGPMDVIKLFSGLSAGQRHNLLYSVRNLLNFCEAVGFNPFFIDSLRRALPKDCKFEDRYRPNEEQIVKSLRRLRHAPRKYNAVYRLLLESGLRLNEAVKLTNEIHELSEKVEKYEKYVCIPLFWQRKTKNVYVAYFLPETLNLLLKNQEKLKYKRVSDFCRDNGLVMPKYLRKFMFNKMLELEIPEGVADFIQGRTPKTVGERHYANLKRLADKYYPRYAEYLEKLRMKV